MRSNRQLVLAALLVGALAAAAAAAAMSSPSPLNDRPPRAPEVVHLTGRLRGMYTSRRAALRVHVHNRLGRLVVVTHVRAEVHRGSGENGLCPASALVVHGWHGRRSVPANGTRTVRLPARMRRRAPDRCQGTRWDITYRAGAEVR
jgi:hypothetical protein